MNNKNLARFLICGMLAVGLLITGLNGGQAVQIRVIVENAAIRSAPSLDSEVIGDRVPLGTLFESEKMVGDWYEIKHRNTLGVLITGYIHKMYVEVAGPEPEAEVKAPEKPAVPPAPPVPPQAQRVEPAKRAVPKGDLAVMGGLVSGSFLSERSTYAKSWSEGGLKSVTESGTISHKTGGSGGLGIAFSYLIAGGLGIQVRYDLSLGRNFASDSQSAYSISWEWTTAGAGAKEETWPATGKLSLSPVSLNVIYKIGTGSVFTPFVFGGVSYFMGKAETRTTRGFGLTWEDAQYQYIDWIDIPLVVEKSIGEIGFNAGAGFDFRIASNIAVTAEAVYFGGKTTEELWMPRTGTYAGNNFPEVSWTVDQEYADRIAAQVTPLEIKTSFLKVHLGVRFLF
jgi:opacity protein-like surface antigen